jgi:hypothetical protein
MYSSVSDAAAGAVTGAIEGATDGFGDWAIPAPVSARSVDAVTSPARKDMVRRIKAAS